MAGIQASQSDLLIFLDADLIHLQPEQIAALIEPVEQGDCVMTLGIFQNGRAQTNWTHRHFYFLSRQRCLRWSAFHQAASYQNARWGIEMALNLVAWRRRLPVQHVPWEGVSHIMRLGKKAGLGKYRTYVEMWKDIFITVAEFSWQQWKRNGRSAQSVRQLSNRQLTISD